MARPNSSRPILLAFFGGVAVCVVVGMALLATRQDGPIQLRVAPERAPKPVGDGFDVLRATRLRIPEESLLRALADRAAWGEAELPAGTSAASLGELQRLKFVDVSGPSTSEERLFYARSGKPAPPVTISVTELGRKWLELHQ